MNQNNKFKVNKFEDDVDIDVLKKEHMEEIEEIKDKKEMEDMEYKEYYEEIVKDMIEVQMEDMKAM